MQSAFMNPFSPIALLIAHVVFHFLLLALINTGHARNGNQISAFGNNHCEHVALFSAGVSHEEVRVCSRVVLGFCGQTLFGGHFSSSSTVSSGVMFQPTSPPV